MRYKTVSPKCLYCTDGHYVFTAEIGGYKWKECHFCGHRLPKGLVKDGKGA